MAADTKGPYEGRDLDGYRAAVCSGVSPHTLRHLWLDPTQRFSIQSAVVLSLLAAASFWGGHALFARGGGTGYVFGALLYIVGILLVLIALIMGALGFMVVVENKKKFRDGLLIPGILTSAKPLVLVTMADMGKTERGKEYGIAMLELNGLPFHSHEPGTRVPCVAIFSEETPSRWLWYQPHVISWGTGDAFDIEQCFQRLGNQPFKQLEASIARGHLPSRAEEIAILDKDFQFVEMRNIADPVHMRERGEIEQPPVTT